MRYTVHCAHYTERITLYTAHYTLLSLHTVQCTLYPHTHRTTMELSTHRLKKFTPFSSSLSLSLSLSLTHTHTFPRLPAISPTAQRGAARDRLSHDLHGPRQRVLPTRARILHQPPRADERDGVVVPRAGAGVDGRAPDRDHSYPHLKARRIHLPLHPQQRAARLLRRLHQVLYRLSLYYDLLRCS